MTLSGFRNGPQPKVAFIVQPVYRVPVRPGDDVPVDIDGGLDGCMAELLFDIVERLALLEQQAGKSVSNIVDAERWQICFFYDPAEDPGPQVIRVGGLTRQLSSMC